MILSGPGLLTIQRMPPRLWGDRGAPPIPGFPGVGGWVRCGGRLHLGGGRMALGSAHPLMALPLRTGIQHLPASPRDPGQHNPGPVAWPHPVSRHI